MLTVEASSVARDARCVFYMGFPLVECRMARPISCGMFVKTRIAPPGYNVQTAP